MGWWSNFFHIIAIFYEVTDKVFDGLTAIEYHKERLFYHPKQPVYHALLTFMIFGCLLSFARISLYLWKMLCIGDGNDDEEDGHDSKSFNGERDEDQNCYRLPQFFDFIGKLDHYYQCDVCVHAIKVIIEAFPQSVIAYIAFDGCPIKTYKWKFLDKGFDVFCIAPYVIFICSMLWWYRCYNRPKRKVGNEGNRQQATGYNEGNRQRATGYNEGNRQQATGDNEGNRQQATGDNEGNRQQATGDNEGNRGRYMSFLTALATVFSIPGCVLAVISFVRSVNCP